MGFGENDLWRKRQADEIHKSRFCSSFAPARATRTATIRALQRLPQCVCELVGTKILNTFGKRERGDGLEHDIIAAFTVAPLVEQTAFNQWSQERGPKEYRKGSAPWLHWPAIKRTSKPTVPGAARWEEAASEVNSHTRLISLASTAGTGLPDDSASKSSI